MLPPLKKQGCPSYAVSYVSHQIGNKTEYGSRAREIEKATLTASVMSTSAGMGKEMDVLVRQMATKLKVLSGANSIVTQWHSEEAKNYTLCYAEDVGPVIALYYIYINLKQCL